MASQKRYVVKFFGYCGNYEGEAEYDRFLPAWFCMWANNDLISSATMIDLETKKEYKW